MKIDDEELLRRAMHIRQYTLAMKALIRDARATHLIVDEKPAACALDGMADLIDQEVEKLEIFALESDPTRGPTK